MTLIEYANKMRSYIEKSAQNLDDVDALEMPTMFPKWSPGTTYTKGTRVRYNEILYIVLSDHTSQSDWTPEAAPSLFAKVLIPDENVIPEWEQPGSANPYMKGDRVMYNGNTYESLIDNNVWSPDAYPAGWKLITT